MSNAILTLQVGENTFHRKLSSETLEQICKILRIKLTGKSVDEVFTAEIAKPLDRYYQNITRDLDPENSMPVQFLTTMSVEELLTIRGIGVGKVSAIKKGLETLNLSLAT